MVDAYTRKETDEKLDLHEVASPWPARKYRYVWVVVALLVFSIGVWGFLEVQDQRQGPKSIGDALYYTLQLFVLEFNLTEIQLPWQLHLARWLAPLVTVITGITIVFGDKLKQWWLAARMHDHVVICGLGRKTLLFTRDYHAARKKVVVIEKDPNNPFITSCRSQGIPVIVGDAARPEILKQARIKRARTLICLTPDDLKNAEIAARSKGLVYDNQKLRKPLECFVHFEDLVVCRNLRDCEVSRSDEHFDVDYFNVFEMGAKALLDDPRYGFKYLASMPSPHLLIVGLGRMAETLLLEVARRWRRTEAWEKHQQKIQVTVVNYGAQAKMRSLMARFHQLTETCDLIVEDPNDDLARFDMCEFAFDPDRPMTAAYVCSRNEHFALETALRLYRYCHERGQEVPIVLRVNGRPALEELLPGKVSGDEFAELHIFSLYEQTCQSQLLVGVNEQLARAMHQYYLRRKQEAGVALGSAPHLRDWLELTEEFKHQFLRRAQSLGKVLHLEDGKSYRIVRLKELVSNFSFPKQDVEKLAMNEYRCFCADHASFFRHTPKPWEELETEEKQDIIQLIMDLPQILAVVDFEIQPVDQSP